MIATTDGRSPDRRRPWWLVAVVLAAVVVTVGVTAVLLAEGRSAPAGHARYHAAVAAEGGVRPLVSDRVGELGAIVALEIRPTPDPELARNHLLAPYGEQRARLSVISDPEPADIEPADLAAPIGTLADGRPFRPYETTGRYVSLATVGSVGQYVEVTGRGLAFHELVTLAGRVEVSRSTLDRLPDGWVELATVPMPPWHHGFVTSYELADGRRVEITAEQPHPDREVLAAFASGDPVDPVDLGAAGGWAYRYRAPSSGVIFDRGDAVVTLSGELARAELGRVARSLRPLEPGEHPILDPHP